MIIMIPSYQRAGKVDTLDFLGDAFSKDEIIIGTQCEKDYEEYTRLYSERATIIFKEGNSCPQNRNNVLEYVSKKGYKEVLNLDDDIRYVRTINDKKIKGKDFRLLMEKCFNFARKNQITLFGNYITTNSMMMRRTITRNILCGVLLGIMDTSLRFDETFVIKDDFELSLRLMSQGKRVARFNSFAAVSGYCTRGGCEETRKKSRYYELAQLLVDAYPEYVQLRKDKRGEIKFIG